MKTRIYNDGMLPVTTYGTEKWVLDKETLHKLPIIRQRRLLGITLRNKKATTWTTQKTKVHDETVRKIFLKWNWAGHGAQNN